MGRSNRTEKVGSDSGGSGLRRQGGHFKTCGEASATGPRFRPFATEIPAPTSEWMDEEDVEK